MMANQLGLRSQKCLTKIAAALEAETSGGPFDLKSTTDFVCILKIICEIDLRWTSAELAPSIKKVSTQ